MREADIEDVVAIESAVSAAQLREELARPWARLWVARGQDARAIAFLLAWHVADEVHVLDVAVHPTQRRQGIARALMNEALLLAREKHARHILLEVRRSNGAAIGLYRAMGFSAMNVRVRYYSNDEDAIEMVLLLDPGTGATLPGADEVLIGETPRPKA